MSNDDHFTRQIYLDVVDQIIQELNTKYMCFMICCIYLITSEVGADLTGSYCEC
jgi:hypothetical protein